MEGASYLSIRSNGYRPAPNDSINNNQKSFTPILDRFKALLKEREEEIVELYEVVLSELIINSKPIITDLTIIAGEQREHGAGIADAICARIIEVQVDHKLPSLYLLDSIVKNIGRDYVRHFSARLPVVYCLAYRQVHPSLHPSMRHLFGTWSTVFPSSVLRKIEAQLQFSPSNYQTSGLKDSESPRSAHGIHVNPKYLEARCQLESSFADSKIQHARAVSAPKILGQPSTGLDEYESDIGDMPSSQIGPQTSHMGRTPFGIKQSRPPSPALKEFSMVDSPRRIANGASPTHHGYGYRPDAVTADDEDLWRRSHGISNGFDIQRPRALINAYGTDERNKTTNQKPQLGKNLTINGLGITVSGPTWQNAEEEEFEWEHTSPTLADHGRATDLFSSSGSSKISHPLGANRFMPTKSDFGRTDWSNQELTLSDRELKRKIPGFQNKSLDTPVPRYSQEPLNLSHEHNWAAQQRYNNPHGQRAPLIDTFPGANSQHHLSSAPPRLNLSTPVMMNSDISKAAWRPPVKLQKFQQVPSSYQFQKHDNTPFLHQQQFDTRPSTQLPRLPNQQIPGQIGKFPHQLSLPQEVRPNILPPPNLDYNPSHIATRPMIRGYNPQSSMPFHLPGVSYLPLPPGPPLVPQIPPTETPPGGGALSGLFSSLVAQGLLSLTKPTLEQDSVGLEFDPDALKTRHESAITALFSDLPRQCKTCGLRFKLQEEHSNHMDWHVTKNRVLRDRKQKPSQKWFANVGVWLSSAEALGADPVPGFFLPSEDVVEKKDDEDMAVPADEDQNVCALCGDTFDDFYSDETEEWMYRDAVYMNAPPTGLTVGMDRSQLGPIVHAKCRSESTVVPPDDSGNNGRAFIEERMRS